MGLSMGGIQVVVDAKGKNIYNFTDSTGVILEEVAGEVVFSALSMLDMRIDRNLSESPDFIFYEYFLLESSDILNITKFNAFNISDRIEHIEYEYTPKDISDTVKAVSKPYTVTDNALVELTLK